MERFCQDLSLINQSVPIVESAAFSPWFIMKYVYVYMHARILMKRFFQDSFLMNQSVHIIDRILLIWFTDACSFFHINHVLVSFAGIQGFFAEMCRALLATCRALFIQYTLLIRLTLLALSFISIRCWQYACIYSGMYTYAYMNMYGYICICICMHVFVYVHARIRVHICICMDIFVYVHVCIYSYMCMRMSATGVKSLCQTTKLADICTCADIRVNNVCI